MIIMFGSFKKMMKNNTTYDRKALIYINYVHVHFFK